VTSLNYRVQRTAVTLSAKIPPRVALAVSQCAGRMSRVTSRSMRRRVRANLAVVAPVGRLRERQRCDRAVAEYLRYWFEAFRLPGISATEVRDGIDVHGWDYVAASIERGKGTILALPHLGGWEWAGRWLALRGVEVAAVAERLGDDEVFELHRSIRQSVGITVIPLGPDAGKEALGVLRRNGVLCLLSDRDLSGDGVSVEFFGRSTTIPGGAATLALRTGATVLPTAVYTTSPGLGHIGLVRPPLDTERRANMRTDVARVTQCLADELAALIAAAPEQWHMFQPRWTHAPYGAE